MIMIEGRRSPSNSISDMEYGKFSVDQIAEWIKQGGRGMLSLHEYTIDGVKYMASGLSIGDETIPIEKGGMIIIPTYFRRFMLSNQPADANPEELTKVNVIVEPSEDLFITIVGI